MRDVEILVDLLRTAARSIREEIADLADDALAWQPDAEGNSIGITVWHVSRWLDLLAVRVLENRPPEEECWHTQGWAARTGYDPRGRGYRGLGALTDYTQAEVAEVPALPAAELLRYLDQVSTTLCHRLLALPAGALTVPAPGGSPTRTAYETIRGPLMGTIGHIGEIEALKALRSRQLAAQRLESA